MSNNSLHLILPTRCVVQTAESECQMKKHKKYGIICKGRNKMISLHPKILGKNGKKEFAVIPYEEFVKIQEELDDYESLKALREAKAKEGNAETTSFDDAGKKFNIE